MLKVNSRIKLNYTKINKLTRVSIQALEQTGEALHTDVVQSQVIPFKDGTLQNESTFVDYTNSNNGKVTLVSSTPYARRLYYHPEYNFDTTNNPYAKGKWYDDWVYGKKKDFCVKTFKALYKRLGGV